MTTYFAQWAWRGAEHAVANVRITVANGVISAVEDNASKQDGDVVIVLGKGHEKGQEIAGMVHPFDDRIELARAIEDKK